MVAISRSQSSRIARYCLRKLTAALPDSPVGTRDMEEMLRDGKWAGGLVNAGFPPEPCALIADNPAGLPAVERVLDGTGTGRLMSGGGEGRGMTADLETPNIAADRPNGPKIAPHFYDDMPHEGTHTSRKQRGARSLLITRLLAMGQLKRQGTLDYPGAEPPCGEETLPHGRFAICRG